MIQEEQQELIEKYVKANAYYTGNEDLLSEFCEEAYNKAYLILNTSNNLQKTENFVSKIVNTTIISILKQRQRYSKLQTAVTEETQEEEEKSIVSTKPVKEKTVVYDFPDPRDSVEDVEITRDLLQRIVDTVCIIHRELPQKLYYDIFYARYVKKKSQSEISAELNIPESEVSKRLLHLSKLVSTYLYRK